MIDSDKPLDESAERRETPTEELLRKSTADGAVRSIRNMRIEQVLLGLLQISIRRPRHLCFRYRFHQQRKCLVETCGAGSFTSIVPEAHHDKIMRRNYQSGLPAGA